MEIDDTARAFQLIAADYGIATRVLSTFRSRSKQQRLRRTRSTLPAAPAGRSTHEYGLAIDIIALDPALQERLGVLGEQLGLFWGGRFGRPDPPHFQVVHPAVWKQWLGA